VPGDGDAAAAAVGVDLPLDRMDVLNRREVEVFAPQERPQPGQELRTRGNVAGDRPRLDHRRAFPVLAQAFVIGLGRQGRERQRRGAGIGPDPQVGAEDIAVGGTFLHRPDQIPGQPHENLLHLFRAVALDALLVEHHDQVDVAGIVELAAAQLAHAENDEPAAVLRPVLVGKGDGAGGGGGAQQVAGGGVERQLGDLGERRRHLLERPLRRDIGQGDQQCGPALEDPQHRHQLGKVRRRFGLGPGDGDKLAKCGVHTLPQQAEYPLHIQQQTAAQKRAIAENGLKQRPALLILGETGGKSREFGVVRPVRGVEPALDAGGRLVGTTRAGQVRRAGQG
jgi:hypothetical protein